jgi:hypothetical protein
MNPFPGAENLKYEPQGCTVSWVEQWFKIQVTFLQNGTSLQTLS